MTRWLIKCRHTFQFYCVPGPGAVLSASCRSELRCCLWVWGSWHSDWSWKRSDDPHMTATSSYRSLGRVEWETPHSPGSPPAAYRIRVLCKVLLLCSSSNQAHIISEAVVMVGNKKTTTDSTTLSWIIYCCQTVKQRKVAKGMET